MSLLMDALKKAELEKKAAELLKQAQDKLTEEKLTQGNEHQGDKDRQDIAYTQESITESSATDLIQSDEDVVAFTESLGDLDNASKAENLSPSLAGSIAGDNFSDQDLSDTKISTTDSFSIEENAQERNDQADRLKLETDETAISETIADQNKILTITDLQINEVSATSTNDTVQVENLLSDTDSREYLGATVSAAQLAEDVGGNLTPVAAQTVFTATSRKGNDHIFQWSIFVTLCLVISVSLSFFVFHYTVPLERSIKSSLIAKDVGTQSESVTVIEIPDEVAFVAEFDDSSFTRDIAVLIEKENDIAIKSREESTTESNTIVHKYFANTVDDVHEKIQVASNNVSLEKSVTYNTAEAFAFSLPEKIIPDPELIKISRSKAVDKNNILVNKAYEEYLASDFDSAEKNYQLVLNNLPENRDALLGLATISLRRGDIRQAYAGYLEVLRLYPKDSAAEVALINFTDNVDYSKSASIIKTFLQNEPDNSFLHYSLARIYAAQQRWFEAQQLFFNAYKIESSNADYAFNLAVSLEHISQQKLAVDYYNVALELADISVVGSSTFSFDRAAVISRVNALSSQPIDS